MVFIKQFMSYLFPVSPTVYYVLLLLIIVIINNVMCGVLAEIIFFRSFEYKKVVLEINTVCM